MQIASIRDIWTYLALYSTINLSNSIFTIICHALYTKNVRNPPEKERAGG